MGSDLVLVLGSNIFCLYFINSLVHIFLVFHDKKEDEHVEVAKWLDWVIFGACYKSKE